MANEFKTRAGILPSNKALPFSVTTSEVEEYLQKRVDAMVNSSDGKVERCEVNVYSTESGKNFIPFIVVLPLSVLANSSKNNDDNNDCEYIFNPKNEDKNVNILPAYHKLFSSYVYDNRDEDAFFSDTWRRQVGVFKKTSYVLKSLRRPKVMNFKGTTGKVVIFMIDPLRVFHDMVTSDYDKRDFRIDIVELKRMEKGKYRYNFKREIIDNKKNKKYQTTIIEELNYTMRGRG